jgi:hypothetical protein
MYVNVKTVPAPCSVYGFQTAWRNLTEDPNSDADCRHNQERDACGSIYKLRASHLTQSCCSSTWIVRSHARTFYGKAVCVSTSTGVCMFEVHISYGS